MSDYEDDFSGSEGLSSAVTSRRDSLESKDAPEIPRLNFDGISHSHESELAAPRTQQNVSPYQIDTHDHEAGTTGTLAHEMEALELRAEDLHAQLSNAFKACGKNPDAEKHILRVLDENQDLIKKGLLDVNMPASGNKKNSRFMHMAAYFRREALVRSLLDARANINAANDTSETPLHMVCSQAHLENGKQVLQLLLEKGANRDAVESSGKKPVDNLVDEGMREWMYQWKSLSPGKMQRIQKGTSSPVKSSSSSVSKQNKVSENRKKYDEWWKKLEMQWLVSRLDKRPVYSEDTDRKQTYTGMPQLFSPSSKTKQVNPVNLSRLSVPKRVQKPFDKIESPSKKSPRSKLPVVLGPNPYALRTQRKEAPEPVIKHGLFEKGLRSSRERSTNKRGGRGGGRGGSVTSRSYKPRNENSVRGNAQNRSSSFDLKELIANWPTDGKESSPRAGKYYNQPPPRKANEGGSDGLGKAYAEYRRAQGEARKRDSEFKKHQDWKQGLRSPVSDYIKNAVKKGYVAPKPPSKKDVVKPKSRKALFVSEKIQKAKPAPISEAQLERQKEFYRTHQEQQHKSALKTLQEISAEPEWLCTWNAAAAAAANSPRAKREVKHQPKSRKQRHQAKEAAPKPSPESRLTSKAKPSAKKSAADFGSGSGARLGNQLKTIASKAKPVAVLRQDTPKYSDYSDFEDDFADDDFDIEDESTSNRLKQQQEEARLKKEQAERESERERERKEARLRKEQAERERERKEVARRQQERAEEESRRRAEAERLQKRREQERRAQREEDERLRRQQEAELERQQQRDREEREQQRKREEQARQQEEERQRQAVAVRTPTEPSTFDDFEDSFHSDIFSGAEDANEAAEKQKEKAKAEERERKAREEEERERKACEEKERERRAHEEKERERKAREEQESKVREEKEQERKTREEEREHGHSDFGVGAINVEDDDDGDIFGELLSSDTEKASAQTAQDMTEDRKDKFRKTEKENEEELNVVDGIFVKEDKASKEELERQEKEKQRMLQVQKKAEEIERKEREEREEKERFLREQAELLEEEEREEEERQEREAKAKQERLAREEREQEEEAKRLQEEEEQKREAMEKEAAEQLQREREEKEEQEAEAERARAFEEELKKVEEERERKEEEQRKQQEIEAKQAAEESARLAKEEKKRKKQEKARLQKELEEKQQKERIEAAKAKGRAMAEAMEAAEKAQEGTQEDSALSDPQNWQEVVDPASGQPYFVNSSAGVTTWERPSCMPATSTGVAVASGKEGGKEEGPLVPKEPLSEVLLHFGWTCADDPASGQTYYCNLQTQETQWHFPEDLQELNNAYNWVAHYSEEHGRSYYHNTLSQETVWERPQIDLF